MQSVVLSGCPGCGGNLEATRLACTSCGIVIEGRFAGSAFVRLSAEQQEFVKTFLAARGNMKLVERQLSISYPTVRNRLEAVQRALGLVDLGAAEEEKKNVREVLNQVESGELSVQQAIEQLE